MLPPVFTVLFLPPAPLKFRTQRISRRKSCPSLPWFRLCLVCKEILSSAAFCPSWRSPTWLASYALPSASPAPEPEPPFPGKNAPDPPPSNFCQVIRALIRVAALLLTSVLLSAGWRFHHRIRGLVPEVLTSVIAKGHRSPRPVRLALPGIVLSSVRLKNVYISRLKVSVANPVRCLIGNQEPRLNVRVFRPAVFIPRKFDSNLMDFSALPVEKVTVERGRVLIEGVGNVGGELTGTIRSHGESGINLALTGRSRRGRASLKGILHGSRRSLTLLAEKMELGNGQASGKIFLADDGLHGEVDVKDGAWETDEIWVEKVEGKFRFNGMKVNVDGVEGLLGELPVVTFGSFEFGKQWDIAAFVHEVGVEQVLETVDVERFVPVEGVVHGGVALKGHWEEPVLSGWAETKEGRGRKLFDKMEVDQASLSFSWDIAAGIVEFPNIQASLYRGGDIKGTGGLYYDMTLIRPKRRKGDLGRGSPIPSTRALSRHRQIVMGGRGRIPGPREDALYQKLVPLISNGVEDSGIAPRDSHHRNSPKARAFRGLGFLPPVPSEDSLRADRHAMHRPWDSMLFKFHGQDIPGNAVLEAYGENLVRPISEDALGMLSGEAIIAGPLRKSVAETIWRMSPAKTASASSSNQPTLRYANGRPTSAVGCVQVALGDPVSARRVRIRTNISAFDVSLLAGEPLEKAGILNAKLPSSPMRVRGKSVREKELSSSSPPSADGGSPTSRCRPLPSIPLFVSRSETLFRGVVHQRYCLEQTNPRTPKVEVVGAQGMLAVRDLSINDLDFPCVMKGELGYGRDMGYCVKISDDEGKYRAHLEYSQGAAIKSPRKPRSSTATISFSGENWSLDLSCAGGKWKVESTQFPLGACLRLPGVAGSELLDANMRFDVKARQGGGSLKVYKSRMIPRLRLAKTPPIGPEALKVIAPLNIQEFGCTFLQERDIVFIRKGNVRQPKSEYSLEGIIRAPRGKMTSIGDFSCDITASSSTADVREIISSLIRSTGSGREARRYTINGINGTGYSLSNRDVDDGMVLKAQEDGATLISEWEVPKLPLQSQLAWFENFIESQAKISKKFELMPVRKNRPFPLPGLSDCSGKVKGTVRFKYFPSISGTWQGPQNVVNILLGSDVKVAWFKPGSEAEDQGLIKTGRGATRQISNVPGDPRSPLPSLFNLLKNSLIEFDVNGEDCKVGMHSLPMLSARGRISGSSVELDHLETKGTKGFEMSATARLAMNGRMKGRFVFEQASAPVLNRYTSVPFRVSGTLGGILNARGSIFNPIVDGLLVWKDAFLNEQRMLDAKSTLKCLDGRCGLEVGALVVDSHRTEAKRMLNEVVKRAHTRQPPFRKKSRKSSRQSRDETKLERRERNLAEKPSNALSNTANRTSEQRLFLSISAPVRFYVKEYLRSRATPPPFGRIPRNFDSNSDSDEGITMDINIPKHGILLLNTFFPRLGFISGDSDISMKVRGTLSSPVVSGEITVKNARVWPDIFPEPVHSLRGHIVINDNLVKIESFRGKYQSNLLKGSGELPLYSPRPDEAQNHSGPVSLSKGIQLIFGKIAVQFKDQFYGSISGRVKLSGEVVRPIIAGNINLSNGVLFLSSPDSAPIQLLATRLREFRGEKPSTTPRGIPPLISIPVSSTSQVIGWGNLPSIMDPEYSYCAVPADEGPKGSPENVQAIKPNKEQKVPTRRLGNALFQEMKLTLGRDIQIVYPYLLNFMTSGTIDISGSLNSPLTSGILKFNSGDINLFTHKMRIKKGEQNTAHFSKFVSPLEPLINLTLEDNELRVQLVNASPKNWRDCLEITGKHNRGMDTSSLTNVLQSRLAKISASSLPMGILKLVTNFLGDIYGISTKLGGAVLKVFPAVIESLMEGEWDDLGYGMEFDTKRMNIGIKKGIMGKNRIMVGLRPLDNMTMEIESDGSSAKAGVEIRVESWGKESDSEREPTVITVE